MDARLGLLNSLQTFNKRKFEGKPVEFSPGNQSLPPPPDRPKPTAKKQGPKLSYADEERIRSLLARGGDVGEIAEEYKVSVHQVLGVRRSMANEGDLPNTKRTQS
jgi:hypothetical protein